MVAAELRFWRNYGKRWQRDKGSHGLCYSDRDRIVLSELTG